MKKLLLFIIVIFLTITLSAQKKSNYEKYWEAREDSINKSQVISDKPEYDDLYYQPSVDDRKAKQKKHRTDVDLIVDTLINENPNIKVSYYYIDNPFYYSYNIGRFYHGGFNYWMYSSYYNNYWTMDLYDWYWESRFLGYPYWMGYWPYNSFYFTDRYSYWGWNSWNYIPWRYNHYRYNQWNNHNYYVHNGNETFQNKVIYGHRERPSALSNNNSTSSQRNRVDPSNRSSYNGNRRTYTPSYENPRMNTRPSYNNSRVNQGNTNRYQNNVARPDIRTQQYRNAEQRRPSTYSVPITNRNHSQPSNDNASRRSIYSQPSNNYSSGSRNSTSNGSNGSYNSSGGGSSSSGGSRR